MLYQWQRYLQLTRVLNSLIVFVTVVISGSNGNSVLAQITPDESLGTESSVVTPDVEIKGETADRIDGGAIRESNLFHSFQEFNVREGQSVYFSSPERIENIFTRVTGNNPSNILGTLGVDGAANLLLLNPNGILFGENSSLDIEGSFLGTTAESLIFRDGAEFSAVEPRSSLLTISVPLGLQVGSNPGNILVQSSLEVPNGQNFSLVGGDIDLRGSNLDMNQNGVNIPVDRITATGGRIELGGLSTTGIINFEDSSNLSFPEGIPRANITLDNFSIDTSAGGGGSIAVYSQNLRLTNSIIATGIDFSVELTQERAGDITIDTAEATILESSNDSINSILNITGDLSEFLESTDNFEVINTAGNAGNIIINTGSLSATGSFEIASITNGEGNAGSVSINANKSIVLENSAESNVNSGIASRVFFQGTGNGADIKINTPSLSLNNAIISTTTVGAGNAGDILINATDYVVVSNGSIEAGTFSSGNAGNIVFESETADLTFNEQTIVSSSVFPPTEGEVVNLPDLSFIGTGKGGDITIKGRNFSATEGVVVSTFTGGEVTADGLANAGNLELNISDSITVSNNSRLETSSIGRGNAGNLTINTDRLSVQDNSVLETTSVGQGNAGNLSINTDKLTVQNSYISTATAGLGQAGKLEITASDFINLSGVYVLPDGRQLFSIFTLTSGDADAGDIAIKTGNLIATQGAQISAGTLGAGNGGNINIEAESIEITGISTDGTVQSGISAPSIGSGTGGKIKIIVNHLMIRDRGAIFAEARNVGDAGSIEINTERLTVENAALSASSDGTGKAGILKIKAAEFINLSGTLINVNGDVIPAGLSSSTTSGNANAGNVTVKTGDLTITDGAQIQTVTTSAGDGGKVDITTNNLFISDRAAINVRSVGDGNAGAIFAEVFNSFEADNGNISSRSDRSSGGDINITAGNIRLKGDSDIFTNVEEGAGGGGNITLTADSVVAFDDSDIFAFSRNGVGGNITINSPVLFVNGFSADNRNVNPESLEGNNRVDINATGLVSGSIDIPDVNFLSDSLVELSEKAIDTEELVANSCVVRDRPSSGTFIITGKGGLPARPGNWAVSTYSTGDVRAIPNKTKTTSNDNNWQPGDPIVEPQGIYRLSNGKLVLSRECR